MKVNVNVKRILSLVLVFAMVLTMMPVTAFAAELPEIQTDLPDVHLTQGRVADGSAYFKCGIEYRFGGGTYNADLYPEPSDALKSKYYIGKDVTSWFGDSIPEGLTAHITGGYGSGDGQGNIRPFIEIGIFGIPTEVSEGREVTITVPGDFYQNRLPVSFHSTIIIEPLGSACSGCTFKTINGMQVCYKEGKGIHVCETNFGDEMNTVGDKYDKNPEDGYISAEEEPSYMTDNRNFWYFFDIEEVDVDTSGFFYLNRFANLRTVNIESGEVVIFGENNTKLESISVNCRRVKGLSEIPSSAPLQKIEIKNATVDRGNWDFPMLEKLVLTDSVIDGEMDDQIFITKDCAALKHIDLNGTDLSHNGSDTNISYDLANLEYLDVSKTGIRKVNIAHYSKLKYFYAKDNGLTEIIGARGEGGKTLADKCPNLVEVDISGNNVSQFDLGAHQNIRKLDLSNNKFTAFSAANLPALKEFHINQKNEAGSYTNELAALYVMNCPQLQLLDASYQMNQSFGVALENLPKLKELDMTECVGLTAIPADAAKVVEILKINNCTGLNVEFTEAKYPKLKELYAKNVTIRNNDKGTRGLFVSAPNVEVIGYNGTTNAEWIELRGTAKLYMFVAEGSSKLKSIKISGADRLQKLLIANNPNLSELTLTGTKALRALDVFNDDSITAIDFSDCWSIERVAASNDIRTLYPDNAPATFKGWRVAKGSKNLSINGDLKGTDELEWVDSRIEFYCHPDTVWGTENWNLAEWDTGKTTRITPFYNEGGYSGSPYQQREYPSLFIAEPYKVTFNLSPYKESSEEIYSYYATEVLDGTAVGLPGLVGWATKKFAAESEIAYYPGQQIIVSGDIELYPVYNTETIVYYSAGNYKEDIGWNMEADEVDGLEEWRSYEYKHTFNGKSSLSDYWTFEILDLVPTREGYIFKGWQYSTANSVNIYQPGDEIEVVGDKSVSLSAKWEKVVEMPSAYTYLSCDKDYFKKGDTVKLTAKVVGLNGVDLSETRFNAFLYLYEEGKENEKTKVAERVFTGDEVDLTFNYPADDTRIAYVEIFAYAGGGDYSQKSITDDYKLVPAKAMDVEFKYSIGDGYVNVTEDTTIVLPQGANDGWLDIEVDAIGGKGELNIRLYEINSNVTVGTDIDNVVSTNTIGTKNYRASVSDETGNTLYTKKLTVKIVPELEVTDMSDDVEIANAQDVTFTIEYVGYNVTATLTNSNGSAVSGLEIVNRPGNDRNGYAGTVGFSIPVPAPASGNTAEYAYEAVLVDEFDNAYYYEFHVYFDKSKGLTFAADGRGTLKFYDNSDKGEYASVFASGTDVAAELDGGWIYDITDSLYASDRNQRPDNVLIPTVGDGVVVKVRLYRYDSYEAYKNGGAATNVYQSDEFLSEMLEFDSNGYADISDGYGASVEYIPGKIDLFADMTPGYYVMTLDITNTSAVGYYDENYCFDIKGFEWWTASGTFEILEDGQEHVHDYTLSFAYNGPQTHSYKCYCGDSYEEDHVFSNEYPIDGLWKSDRFSYYDENGKVAYADSNLEERWCTICSNSVYRWRFLESFAIGNADLQEGKTDAYEKMMDVDQTLNLVTILDFLEEFDPRTSTNSFYTNTLSGRMADFYPVNTKINWTSSNQDVAKVDENGVVTAVGEGTALITATTVQPGKETGEPMTVTILISVNCQHTKHMVKVPAMDPTCQADGHVEHYMCLDCMKYSLTGDFDDTVSYESDIKIPQVDHAKLYGVWHSDASGHWRECKYECGTTYDFESHYASTPADCQNPESCDTCGYILSPVTDHSHDKYGWSDGYHWSICECGVVVTGSNEVHQFGADGSSDTCDDCGFVKVIEIPGYTVSGTITSYLKAEGDITVQMIAADETVAYSTVVNTYSGTGTFTSTYSIPEVADGTYTLRVSKANHVTRDYEVTVEGGEFTQDAVICPIGDVTLDGKVNMKDWGRMREHVDKSNLLTGYSYQCADVMIDSKVNMKDWGRMREHIDKSNPLW